jgi:diguanylate cyclase (GGDEF)-like protein
MGYVIFILAGMATGAIIQSLVYWPQAVAFGAPLVFSIVWVLLKSGGPVDYLIASNVFLLSVMLARASVLGEKGFRQSKGTALRAMSLAESLTKANREIGRSHRALEQIANNDPLTGLSNRTVFNRQMEALDKAIADDGSQWALILLDIDKFKSINDGHGHHVGDQVLRYVAESMEALAGSNDLAVRLGGDEFALLVKGDACQARAVAFAEALLARLANLNDRAEFPAGIGASIGIALAPAQASNSSDLYAYADLALYKAKEDGRKCIRLFDDALGKRLAIKRTLQRDLGPAIETGEIEVHFQPQVVMATGKPTGFEALIRWNHPNIGPVSPEEIVATANDLGLSRDLAVMTTRRACAFILEANRRSGERLAIGVNLSPREFNHYSPADLIVETVRESGLSPDLFEIEITEEALLDPKKAVSEIERFKAFGLRVAVDDFGMGHSSLAYLLDLKIDRLKVDRSFVAGIDKSRHNQALVIALVSVGRSLDIDLVMEGVETEGEAETLRMLGCKTGQGWLYGRAMPPEQALAFLDGKGDHRQVA